MLIVVVILLHSTEIVDGLYRVDVVLAIIIGLYVIAHHRSSVSMEQLGVINWAIPLLRVYDLYIHFSRDHQRTSSTDEIDDASAAAQAPLLCCLATTRQPQVYTMIYNSATTNNNNNRRRRRTHTTRQFPVATARLPCDYIIIY